MTRVAAIDCGTNSIRLLVAQLDPGSGVLTDLDRRMQIVRLGQDVDRTGRLAPQALARTLAATREYAQVCADLGVRRIRFVATSATRDAGNGAEFLAGVRALIGVDAEVISGTEEAALSFVGATRGLGAAAGVAAGAAGGSEPAGRPPLEPVLVVDLGGGSTEVVLGTGSDGRVEASRSVDVGSVRLTERHLAGDPPSQDELVAARAEVDRMLDQVADDVPLDRARQLVGLAGSVTTVTAHALRLPRYDSARIHGCVLPVSQVRAACEDLVTMSREQRAALPYLHPGRVDVIGAGALIWDRVLGRVSVASGITEVVTSEHDILDGIAWSLVEPVGQP